MSENITQEHSGSRSFEERVFARFDALDQRFTSLDQLLSAVETELSTVKAGLSTVEAALENHASKTETALNTLNGRLTLLEQRVDERLKETRPIWEGVQLEIRRINAKFEAFVNELFELRTDHNILRRVDHLVGVSPTQ